MALPIIPLLIGAAILAIAGKKKPTRITNGGGAPEPKTISVTVEELKSMGEIPMFIGDTLKVSAPEVLPSAWVLFTEATAGEPMVVVAESHIDGTSGADGDYGTKEFKIDAVQKAPSDGMISMISAGTIRADFALAENPDVPAETIASVNLLIMAP